MSFSSKYTIILFISILIQIHSFGSIYEAETASLYKAVTETKNSGYLGDSYVNFDNESGSYLEIRIGMAVAGIQKIVFRFANGTASNRPMEIRLNGEKINESLIFKSTGSWTNWDTISLFANLHVGVNVLRCVSTGSEGGPNLDRFEVSGEQAQIFNLNLSVGGDGRILQYPGSTPVFKGEKITLIAKPVYNSVFKNWTGDFSSENDTLEFVLDENKTIVAHFSEIEINPPEPDFSMIGYATVRGEGLETTTGGAGGKVTVVENLAGLVAWGASREDNYTAETLIIKGKIEAETTTVISVKRGKNISILGDSESAAGFAELKNISFNIRQYSNVIIRNLKMHEVFYPDDDLTIDECHHVWIDHCEFHSKIGAGTGVDTYDGLLDIKNGSHNVTVSWCWFHDHMKTVLIGHSDNNAEKDVSLEVTFHHNWFSNTDGRNPSLRFGKVHFFNNYLENITDYGFAVRNGAHAKIENCHFESVNIPIATDKFDGHGFACISGCIYSGSCTENSNQVFAPFDCDFWDDKIPYLYQPENVNTVKKSVEMYAGVGKIRTITSSAVLQKAKNLVLKHCSHNSAFNNIVLDFETGNNQNITITVFSAEGKKMFITNEKFQPGCHRVQVPTNKVRKGIYIVAIENQSEKITRKLVLY